MGGRSESSTSSSSSPSDRGDNNRGGARESKESKPSRGGGGADSGSAANPSSKGSFETSMSNAERPDRAPAATPDTSSNSNDTNSPNATDKPDDKPDRAAGPPGIGAPPSQTSPTGPTSPNENESNDRAGGFFGNLAETLTAPPTDAAGNPRSTSPVADRLNNTVNYSFGDVANFFGLTSEQSQNLANGTAVMDGVMVTPPPNEQVSLYLSDLRLQQRGLEYQRQKLEESLPPFSPGNQLDPKRQELRQVNQQIQNITERREALNELSRPDLATGQVPEVLRFDPADDGQIVVAYGDINNATHIAVMVPGMQTNLENFTEFNKKSIELIEDLNRQPGVRPAVISYLGYDSPDYFEALSSQKAVEGAPALRDLINSLPEEAYVQKFAHSYGSLLAGEALRIGARPDALHILGSPGIGVDDVRDYIHNGEVVVSATENPWDPVADTNYYGQVPPENAINYPSTGTNNVLNAHFFDQYFDAAVFRDIMTGRRQPIADDQ